MKVVIAGYGVEGRASFLYWRTLGAEVAIADQRDTLPDAPEEVQLILGADAFDKLADFDIVVRYFWLFKSCYPNPERNGGNHRCSCDCKQ